MACLSRSQIFLILMIMSSLFSSGGSRKELRDKESKGKSFTEPSYVIGSKFVDPRRVLQLSWQPRVFLYRGFLSEEESDHLISLVNSGDTDGKTQLASSGYVLDVPDPIVAGIEEKISAWTFLPREHSGSIKVRSYTSEMSGKKLDYFGQESSSVSQHDSLLATVILYLSNTTQGGELLFPNSEVKRKKSWSECLDTGGNILRPVKGNAILFFSRHLNASLDQTSTHLRCPVVKGELLVATKLMYAKKQARNDESEECSDEDENCGRWAELGECKKNPVYMIGSPDYFGTCRKSCNAC